MSSACPQCEGPVENEQHRFCTSCGLALKQPCPRCSAELVTPSDPFISCATCLHDFWSCRACGRVYHLDRTSCHNSYCPEKGKFWTTQFGAERFLQRLEERCSSSAKVGSDSPRPAWTGGVTAASDLRWPSLHTLGLLLSVQESGVVELWAECGAPTNKNGAEFSETSVCLTRLDLGEVAPCPPFFWQDQFILCGTRTLSVLEMTSSPSVGRRIDISQVGTPELFGLLESHLVVWGDKDFGALDRAGNYQSIETELKGESHFLLTDGESSCLAVSRNPKKAHLFDVNEGDKACADPTFAEELEFGLYCDRYILISGNKLAYLEDLDWKVVDLPGLVVSPPLYHAEENRLVLMLNDGTARTCSTVGDKFSFLCELAGTPTTEALLLDGKLFYGTEGRYLCCDEEAIRPRLSSPPMGAISYANGRIFGTLRDGSMFCFEL